MTSSDRKLAVTIVLVLIALMVLIAVQTEGSGRLIFVFALLFPTIGIAFESWRRW